MGLGIYACGHLTKLDCVYNEDGEPIDPQAREPIEDYISIRPNEDFPGRENGLVRGEYRSSGDSCRFRAGSYRGYSWWRNELAKMVGYQPLANADQFDAIYPYSAGARDVDSGPFWEQIWFSDCEGVIGPEVCAKLAADYSANQSKADTHEDERFRQKYAEWRKAFEIGADAGAVIFS